MSLGPSLADMTGAAEAVGDVATGAAWARVIEPGAGTAAHMEGHGPCLNCGTALAGRYCHACGQSSHVHRTLMSIVHDLLHGVFHFEGKIWRTIPMLVWRPGELTRRYIAGERARFVSPLALFLFTVFLMFATFSAFGSGDLANGLTEGWSNAAPKMEQQRAADAAALDKLEQRRAAMAAAREPVATIDRQIAERRADLTALTRMQAKLTGDANTVTVHSNLDWIDRALKKARANPGLALYKVQSAAYKFSWVLIFLSTPFVALLFLWRRRFGLYDHATFVTYSITFMSLLAIVLELLLTVNAPKWLFFGLLLIVPPAHMFRQLRGAYGLGTWGAGWRTVVLLHASTLTLAAFVVGVIALEVAG